VENRPSGGGDFRQIGKTEARKGGARVREA
jgi:hypothetical protein